MLKQVVRTALRASTKVFTQRLPSHKENLGAFFWCREWDSGRSKYSHMSRGTRQFCSRNESDESETDAKDMHSRQALEKSDNEELCDDDDDSDAVYSDHEIFEAFQNELALDDEDEEVEASDEETQSDKKSQKVKSRDEEEKRPWNTKERVKACLDKLQKGPDGRYINVFEVATEVDILIASYLKLRKQDDPDRAENSDDDEKYLEGIDIEKFKRLQKRLRDGTYEFQPIVQVPLPKRKVVKLKKKRVKKQPAF